MHQFKPGDIVQLRSGGPPMTVDWCKADPSESGQGQAKCSWFDKKNNPRWQVFPATSLKLYQEPEERKAKLQAS
jgi:uncharacterized protein YodC (DUF2158 family)